MYRVKISFAIIVCLLSSNTWGIAQEDNNEDFKSLVVMSASHQYDYLMCIVDEIELTNEYSEGLANRLVIILLARILFFSKKGGQNFPFCIIKREVKFLFIPLPLVILISFLWIGILFTTCV